MSEELKVSCTILNNLFLRPPEGKQLFYQVKQRTLGQTSVGTRSTFLRNEKYVSPQEVVAILESEGSSAQNMLEDLQKFCENRK